MAQTDTTIRYIESDFETAEDQQKWVSTPTDNTIKWIYATGGNGYEPPNAYSGSINALFYWSDLNPFTRTLVSSAIDLSTAKKPELSFAHAMSESVFGQDNMILLFRAGSSGTWDIIEEYTQAVPSWTVRNINIKDYGTKYLTEQFYVAFRGISNSGDGVCVDKVIIEEKDIIIRYPKTVDIKAVNHDLIPSGVTDIPVIRVNIVVVGNTNPATLNSMVFKSLSTSDDLFKAVGFELVATRDSIYRPTGAGGASLRIGSATSISGGIVSFSGINYNLPTGFNCIWLVADIKESASHGSSVDFRMDANALMINGTSYPAAGVSPAGVNTIEEAILFDSFETNDKGWVFQGAKSDFEMAVPQGKFAHISHDPDYAYSGSKSLGTDLTNDGKYELNISTAMAYYAVSPVVNLKFYANVKLHFMKWLSFEANDHATIEVSTDTAKTWTVIWDNKVDYVNPDTRWLEYTFTKKFNDIAARKPWVQVRIGITYTDGTFSYAGWNLDNFSITGNFLTNDVGITLLIKPVDDCLNPGLDVVTIQVKNFAPNATASSLPVFFSVDGTTKVYGNIPGPIPVDGQVTFTFSQPANITVPGLYNSFIVELDIPGDEDASNDTVTRDLFIQKSLSVPHYETFEAGSGYWRDIGTSTTWECKQPEGIISPQPGSPKAWILSPYGPYLYDDTSYVVSSCYDLVSGDRLIYEMRLWLDAEEGKDGASVEYTVNDGQNWALLSANPYGWDWNWYNTYVTSLGTQGWSKVGAGWKTVRQLLPASLASEPKVKFRIKWTSDSQTNFRGVVFDNVNIYTAPDDIGVTAIHDFADACEGLNPDQLTVTLKNYGLNAMNINDTIVVGFDLDNHPVAIDTFKLTQNLASGQTMNYSFSEEIEALPAGPHTITAYTLIEGDPWFYEGNNDTVSVAFTVFPKPDIGLFDTIQTREPDTVILRPVYNANYDYKWQDNTTTSTYDVDKGGWYIVTVTDTRGNGCSAMDSTYVELLFYDVGVDSMIYPVNACSLPGQEYVTLRIRNYGTDSIPAGEKIKAAFLFNNITTVIDTLTLSQTLYSKHTIIYPFTKGAVNLANKGTYTFKLWADYAGDTVYYNDTLNKSVIIFGNPVANLGPDLTVQALSHTLDAGAGYIDYLWDNSSTSRTRNVTETGTYWVWVLDANNCSDFDTVYVRLKIRDISPQLENPLSACIFNPSETVRMRVMNTGTDTVPSGETINVRYRMNSGDWINGSLVLSGQLIPSAGVTYTFPGTVNLSSPNDYLFTLVAKTGTDIRVANDTLVDTIYRYEKPVVDFGLGESYTARVTEFPIEAGIQPFYSYLWQDGSTEHEYLATTSGIYRVKVTDTRTACYGGDTVTLFLIIDDIGVTSSTLGNALCSGTYSNVQVTVKNLGTTSIGDGEKIYLGYDLNGSRIGIDTLVLDRIFAFGTTRTVTLKKPITISPSGTPVIDFYTLLSEDMRPQNDTLTLNPTVKSSPVVDFGDINGTLMVALPHVLDAGSGQKAYLWNDGSAGQTYNVTTNGTYSVTVTGQNDCQTYKVVQINPTSAKDLPEAGAAVMVYPNPSNGLFFLDITLKNPSALRISLVSVSGQMVSNQTIAAQESLRVPVDLSGYPKGIYQILVTGDSILYKAKVIIY